MPGSFMLVLLTARSYMVKQSDKSYVSILYILDTISNVLRECKFNIPRPYNDLTIEHTYLGYYSMVRTYAFENSRPK